MRERKGFNKLFTLSLGLLTGTLATADTLTMKNGSVLVGKLVSAEPGSVVFDTPFAGQLTIKAANIAKVEAEDPVTLLMADGEVYHDKRIEMSAEDRQVVVLNDVGDDRVYSLDDMELVNPEPWRLGEGYKWFGTVSVALESERGNSDTDEWDLAVNSVWRSLEDRYTVELKLNLV